MQKYVCILSEKDLKVNISKDDTNFKIRSKSWIGDFSHTQQVNFMTRISLTSNKLLNVIGAHLSNSTADSHFCKKYLRIGGSAGPIHLPL